MNDFVLRNLSYGMYLVGAKDEKLAGCIVNTIVQITSDPKTIAVSINHNNYTNEIIKKTSKFSVSILPIDINPEIIGTFGYKSSRDIDKFKNIEIDYLEDLPVLKSSCGNILCNVIDTLETSTHTVFLGEIQEMTNYQVKEPMTYKYYYEVLKGKSPKNAPTYVKEEKSNETIWVCSTCGYEIVSDSLPEDFVCPICGEPVTVFKKK